MRRAGGRQPANEGRLTMNTGTPRSVSLRGVQQTPEERVSERPGYQTRGGQSGKGKRIDFAGRHRFLAAATGNAPALLAPATGKKHLIEKQIISVSASLAWHPLSRVLGELELLHEGFVS